MIVARVECLGTIAWLGCRVQRGLQGVGVLGVGIKTFLGQIATDKNTPKSGVGMRKLQSSRVVS